MRIELAYPTTTLSGNPTIYNLSRTSPTWFSVLDSEIKRLDNLHLDTTKAEGNQVKKTMTGDLEFFDSAKDLLLTAFYNSATPVGYMWVRIYDCTCNIYIFTGQITRDKIEWCSQGCSLICRATQYDEVTDAYNSLNNVLNYDAYLADTNEHVLNFLIRNGDSESGASHYQEAVRVGGLLKDSIHSLPEFVFKSSILDSPTGCNGWTGDKYGITNILGEIGDINVYYHSYILNADISRGLVEAKTGNSIRYEHRYLRTIKDFLNEQKTIFNADYLLKKVGSEVHFIFERKDYFFQTATIWKDCTKYNICFELDNRNQYAYADMKWATESNYSDAVDINLSNNMYNLIKEWNNPVSPVQKAAYTALTQYGYAPVGNDTGHTFISMRKPYTFSTPTMVIPGDFSGIAPLGPYYTLGTFSLPQYTSRLYDLNSPFYFNGDLASIFEKYTGLGLPPVDYARYRNVNLYDFFHFIENPRNTPNNVGYTSRYSKKYLRFTVTVNFTCDDLLSFDNDSAVLIDVLGTTQKGMIESVDWDLKKGTCTIKGII